MAGRQTFPTSATAPDRLATVAAIVIDTLVPGPRRFAREGGDFDGPSPSAAIPNAKAPKRT